MPPLADETVLPPIAPAASSDGFLWRNIAVGSAWMIGARWSIRGIGLVSTVILARLLRPTDFGLVAMGMVTMGFVRVLAESGGQYLAVIRHPNPTAEHLDTAWTMSVLSGLLIALGLVAIAPLGGWYFHDSRVVPVIMVLALVPLAEGLNNVGVIVGFRRDLAFNKDFRFQVLRKLSVFAVSLPLALILQTYWALAIGTVCGRVLTTVASYWMHPYRPHWRLTKIWEIWSYSLWMQLAAIGYFFREQVDQVVLGGLANARLLGDYNVASDVATAPTRELVAPTSRVVFPIFATLLEDRERLARSYLDLLSVLGVVGLATGVGVALVAHDMVVVVLGSKWLAAVRLVAWLAVAGAVLALETTVDAVLSVTDNARMNAMRVWGFSVLLVPAAVIGGKVWGVEGVAAARAMVTFLFVPVMFYALMGVIPVTAGQIAARLWRPTVAAVGMAALVSFSGTSAIHPVALRLICNVALGAAGYLAIVLALWFAAGRPPGAERMLLAQASAAMRRSRMRLPEPAAGPAKAAKPAGAAKKPPFFIVGSGRSGTTLLRLMLCGHSQIHIPPETWYIVDLIRELPLTAPLTASQVDRAVEIMTGHDRWSDMGIPAEAFRRWVSALQFPKLVDIVDLVYQYHLDIRKKSRFGGKTPKYIWIIPELSALYPGAKFLNLIRDGRDVAISFMDVGWARYYDRRFEWRGAVRRRSRYRNTPYEAQILDVRYEDLVTSPEQTLRKICHFLGEEFEVGMLDWHDLLELVPERERWFQTSLERPLSAEAVGVWRRKLSVAECFAVEACLHRDLRRLGYPLRFSAAGWRPLFAAVRWLLWLSAPLLRQGIAHLQARRYLPRTIYI